MQPKYDILLKSGEVIDPSQNMRGRYDVALADGKVALVAENIPAEQARQVKDVTGKLVTPGLIDMHGHFYHGFLRYCIDPDRAGLNNGVTTAVDAGTCGADTFAGFRDFTIPQSQVRLYCFLHVCCLGLAVLGFQGDLFNLSMGDVDKTVQCIEQNREHIVGIKVRISTDATGYRNAVAALEMALQAGEKSKTPVMAHPQGPPHYDAIPVTETMARLRPGDIVTHFPNLQKHDLLGPNGKVRPEIWSARERGIIFDTGHGSTLSNITVRIMLEQGLWPDVLSSDIIDYGPISEMGFGWSKPAYLLDVMNKFWVLGVPLEEVIRCNTINAAKAIGLASEIGTLRPGTAGDVTVLEIQEGDFEWTDRYGYSLKSRQKLAAVMTICNGKVCYNKN